MNNLSRQALLQIMKQSRPEDILSLCQVDKRLQKICAQEKTWLELFYHFYPDRELDRKRSYREHFLTNVKSIYNIEIDTGNWPVRQINGENIHVPDYPDSAQLGDKNNPEEFYITISGPPFREDVKLWVTFMDFRDAIFMKAYRTKIAACEEFADQIFNKLYEQMSIYIDIEDEDQLIDDLALELRLPSPFTREKIIETLQREGIVVYSQGPDDTDAYFFSVKEVAFTH
jgi:hypothetical protein